MLVNTKHHKRLLSARCLYPAGVYIGPQLVTDGKQIRASLRLELDNWTFMER